MLSNRVYQFLKWFVVIFMPGFGLLIGTIGTDLGIQDPDTMVRIINALTLFLGGLIGVSTYQYQKVENKKIDAPKE